MFVQITGSRRLRCFELLATTGRDDSFLRNDSSDLSSENDFEFRPEGVKNFRQTPRNLSLSVFQFRNEIETTRCDRKTLHCLTSVLCPIVALLIETSGTLLSSRGRSFSSFVSDRLDCSFARFILGLNRDESEDVLPDFKNSGDPRKARSTWLVCTSIHEREGIWQCCSTRIDGTSCHVTASHFVISSIVFRRSYCR